MGITTDGDQADQLEGGTDGTIIGNVGDRLKVTTGPGTGGSVGAWDSNLVYQDMNASNGGIARGTAVGTSFTDLYTYTGSGLISGFLVNTQTLSDWTFQFEIDSVNVFDTNGLLMSDMLDTALYGFGDLDDRMIGLRRSGNIFQWVAPNDFPIAYSTSVKVKAKTAGSKNFNAGLIALSKET